MDTYSALVKNESHEQEIFQHEENRQSMQESMEREQVRFSEAFESSMKMSSEANVMIPRNAGEIDRNYREISLEDRTKQLEEIESQSCAYIDRLVTEDYKDQFDYAKSTEKEKEETVKDVRHYKSEAYEDKATKKLSPEQINEKKLGQISKLRQKVDDDLKEINKTDSFSKKLKLHERRMDNIEKQLFLAAEVKSVNDVEEKRRKKDIRFGMLNSRVEMYESLWQEADEKQRESIEIKISEIKKEIDFIKLNVETEVYWDAVDVKKARADVIHSEKNKKDEKDFSENFYKWVPEIERTDKEPTPDKIAEAVEKKKKEAAPAEKYGKDVPHPLTVTYGPLLEYNMGHSDCVKLEKTVAQFRGDIRKDIQGRTALRSEALTERAKVEIEKSKLEEGIKELKKEIESVEGGTIPEKEEYKGKTAEEVTKIIEGRIKEQTKTVEDKKKEISRIDEKISGQEDMLVKARKLEMYALLLRKMLAITKQSHGREEPEFRKANIRNGKVMYHLLRQFFGGVTKPQVTFDMFCESLFCQSLGESLVKSYRDEAAAMSSEAQKKLQKGAEDTSEAEEKPVEMKSVGEA